ncbi:MAG: septum formation protein Maf [Spirochaetales bacterium]|nr:septum formation protein Maf [Spirochaetales bacterium]
MEKLILASASLRRQEILMQMGLEFDIRPQDVDETFTGLAPADEAVLLAKKKTAAFLAGKPSGAAKWVLGADTFIEIDGEYLGKPETREEAGEMLKRLSGLTHQVITGIALNVPEKGIKTAACLTAVTFSPMSASEIDWYLDQNEWQGVAAAYRIQEKGALFISSINGSYSNVMGLPINTFYGMLISDKFNFRT